VIIVQLVTGGSWVVFVALAVLILIQYALARYARRQS
jgi:hypothetical protein